MAAERSLLVFGAGSVGGYLGGKLAAVTSWSVTLLGRAALVNAVTDHGLVVCEHGSESVSHPVVIPKLDNRSSYDLVMLTVRTYDVARVIPELEGAVGESGLLLAMQNGVGTEEALAERPGRDRIIVGTLTVRPGMDQPGVVMRYSQSGGVALAGMTGSPPPEWIVDAFRATGLPTIVVDDYRSLRWSKLLLNMLGAATSAILDIDVRSWSPTRNSFGWSNSPSEKQAASWTHRVSRRLHFRAIRFRSGVRLCVSPGRLPSG